MAIYRVRAKDSGRRVSWERLLAGEIVDQSLISFSATTILTDVLSELVALCHTLDADTRHFCVSTNHQTGDGFTLFLVGKGFELTCTRVLARSSGVGLTESGSDFDVLISIGGESSATGARLASLVKSGYEHSIISE